MLFTYLLVALSLAMDAFAVSVSAGICIPDLKPRHGLRTALAFGSFQFLMPVLGWYLGGTFRALIQGFDHWIAFVLLVAVGGKMLLEARKMGSPESCPDEEKSAARILDLGGLLVLALATSIDALAVGLSYSIIGSPILLPATVIGIVTFALSFIGCEFGKRIGARFERWATLAGGLVLIGIGVKIALEHLLKAV
jgi:manganese efflux pump family protein